MRAPRWIVAAGTLVFLFFVPLATSAVEVCCRCQKAAQRVCVQNITDNATPDCADVLRQSPTLRGLQTAETALFDGFNCSTAPLTSAQCRTVAAGGVCGGDGFVNPPLVTPGQLVAALRPAPAPATTPSSAGTAATATSSQKRPFVPITPELGVPIQGLQLSPAVLTDSAVSVPFLAQYIAGAYRYALRIALVAAIIMVVYGGFRYLIGSAFSDVTRGKEIVKDAIMGLLVIIGGYLILQTVNPNILKLQNIELRSVETEIIEFAQRTTRIETRGDTIEHPSGDGGSRSVGPSGSGATYSAPSNQNCPVPNLPPGCGSPGLQNCNDMPVSQERRAPAFKQLIGQYIRSTDPRQRLLDIANATVDCGIHFGSCGHTAESIFEAAGLRGHRSVYSASEVGRLGNRLSCGTAADCHRIRPSQYPDPHPPGCLTDTAAATAQVREFARPNQDAAADLLQPGDWVKTYNGNNSCGGGHSWIFMGWESPGSSWARLVDGAWPRLAGRGRTCLRTRCRNFSPIYKINRPSSFP